MTTAPFVIPSDVSVYTLPRRSYDWNKGDRRFFSLEDAIDWGNLQARETGVRQMVRSDSPVLRRDTWVVQAIGS